MPTCVDYLVVGSGLTGGTVARVLHDQRREVLILERRPHPGGNVHDSLHSSRIRVHTYGPHYFRCSSQRIWDFVNRFSSFYSYEARVQIKLDGQYQNWPINRTLLNQYPGWDSSIPTTPPANFEEACLRKMPRPVYQAFIEGYTRKQWGLDPRLLSPDLADRIRVNNDDQTTLTPQFTCQALPTQGYSQLMESLIAGIPCRFGVDYLQAATEFQSRKALVFTGPIDEYFGFDLGRLGYRAHQRVHRFLPDCERYQPCAQVNHPDSDDHGPLRTLEWKHLLPSAAQAQARGTLITYEHPFTPADSDEFEYPVPTARNARLYEQYRRRASSIPKLVLCGRLGSYCYLDMDQAMDRALRLAEKLLCRSTTRVARDLTPHTVE
jgi:UDP-galactopyranose mutase